MIVRVTVVCGELRSNPPKQGQYGRNITEAGEKKIDNLNQL